jgi:hypothetical protein
MAFPITGLSVNSINFPVSKCMAIWKLKEEEKKIFMYKTGFIMVLDPSSIWIN